VESGRNLFQIARRRSLCDTDSGRADAKDDECGQSRQREIDEHRRMIHLSGGTPTAVDIKIMLLSK
jgi:hypothetical protein